MHPDRSAPAPVFVYGSLRRGEYNHRLLAGAEYGGEARVQGFALYSLGAYPMAIAGRGCLVGELYHCTPALLRQLDRLEEHPHVYQRQWVALTDGREAWLYVGRSQLLGNAPCLEHGDWCRRSSGGTDSSG